MRSVQMPLVILSTAPVVPVTGIGADEPGVVAVGLARAAQPWAGASAALSGPGSPELRVRRNAPPPPPGL